MSLYFLALLGRLFSFSIGRGFGRGAYAVVEVIAGLLLQQPGIDPDRRR
jgi:hypothetical protein